MKLIYLEEAASNVLIERLKDRIKEMLGARTDRWISGAEAMKMRCFFSKATLQKLRDESKTRFTRQERKVISYYIDSANENLDKNATETF